MAARGSGGEALAVGLGVAAVVGLVAWAASEASKPPPARVQRAVRIRRQADRTLYQALLALASNPWVGQYVRHCARLGAREFRRRWIDVGYSGRAIPTGVKLAIYGNWCGPGHGGGPCIDELDCLCRAHDLAYEHADDVDRGWA